MNSFWPRESPFTLNMPAKIFFCKTGFINLKSGLLILTSCIRKAGIIAARYWLQEEMLTLESLLILHFGTTKFLEESEMSGGNDDSPNVQH